MRIQNKTKEDKESIYYPFSLEDGRSIYLEKRPDEGISVWDCKRIKNNLSKEEALEYSDKIYRNEL